MAYKSKRQPTQAQIAAAKAKREQLRNMSKAVKPLVEAGDFESINEALKACYMEQDEDITEFNTFMGWKDKGMKVKKDMTSFLIWGKKRKGKKELTEEEKEAEKKDEFSFFPVAYLFSNCQVEPMTARS